MKKVGRPRAFDPDEALETAMRLFWQKGYEGTSLTDLTEAIGVNRPSLYAVFGNKEELFRRACARYSERSTCPKKVPGETARDVTKAFLLAAVQTVVDPEHPGCMLVTSALAGSDESETIREELCAARQSVVVALTERFQCAEAKGETLPASAADLARFVVTVSSGMTVLARSGATEEDLRRVVDVALLGWPEGAPEAH
jgi:AcrR family transcriptional regulator